jgi:hypothetical protein
MATKCQSSNTKVTAGHRVIDALANTAGHIGNNHNVQGSALSVASSIHRSFEMYPPRKRKGTLYLCLLRGLHPVCELDVTQGKCNDFLGPYPSAKSSTVSTS